MYTVHHETVALYSTLTLANLQHCGKFL